MKKIISIICASFLFVSTVKAADLGMGISGAIHYFDASGEETTRQSGEKNSGSHDEAVFVPEIFAEAIQDNGFAIGISYIPTREMDGKSRTDTSAATGQESGTYTAKAELEIVLKVYTDIPTGQSFVGGDLYVHLGLQHVTVATLESLNSGETYPNRDLLGATFGLGAKGDLPYGDGLYYKGEVTYTNFETYEADGTAGNKVSADLDDYAARFSIGKRF